MAYRTYKEHILLEIGDITHFETPISYITNFIMSPALDTQNVPEVLDLKAKNINTPQASLLREPLKSSGSLKEYENFNSTPIIGTEFPNVQLTEILKDETKIRDLAILGEFISLYLILNQSSLQ